MDVIGRGSCATTFDRTEITVRRKRLMRFGLLATLVLSVTTALGCAPTVEPGPSPSTDVTQPANESVEFSEEAVRTGLEELFGDRLGRSQVGAGQIRAEVTGELTDAELLAPLLLFVPYQSHDETLSVWLLDASQSGAMELAEWDMRTGHLVRGHGMGGETLVLPQPADGAYASAYSLGFDAGVIDVDEDTLRAYATGAPVPWGDPIR